MLFRSNLIILESMRSLVQITVVLVDLDRKEKEFKEKNRAVKKTLTIPYWVNEKASAMNINFSQTLTEALIEKFN